MSDQPVSRERSEDEFGWLHENADEAGISIGELPPVRRIEVETSAGLVSALRWGEGPPRVVLLHGGGQNAHTWDSLILSLGVPALAVDLPGHGHSAWREDADYSPVTSADTIAAALSGWNVGIVPVVGMSRGGLTAIALAARHPTTASRIVIIDVTPSVLRRVERMSDLQRGATALIRGKAVSTDFESLLEAAVLAAPHRPRAALRRGVLHNAKRLPDGLWTWRYDHRQQANADVYELLWDDAATTRVPITLVRGGDSAFVQDTDVAELLHRRPDATVEVIPGAGHSVQSDRPRELAALIRNVLDLH